MSHDELLEPLYQALRALFNHWQEELQLLIDINQLERYETLVNQEITYLQQKIDKRQHEIPQDIEETQKRLDRSTKNKSVQRNNRDQIRELHLKLRNLQRFQTVFEHESIMIRLQFEEVRLRILQQNINEQNGLTSERIQKFHQFLADESLAGDQCGMCLDDIEVGRKMMRLDCNGQHVFCHYCCETWFADNNICPYCRQVL